MRRINNKVLGVQYIYVFNNNVQSLNHFYGLFFNSLLEIGSKYGIDNQDKIDDNERALMLGIVQNIRYSMVQCVINIETIGITKPLRDLYDKIKKQLIFNDKDLESFVIEVNKVLAQESVQNVLRSNRDIINDLFKNETTSNDKGESDNNG